MYLTRFFYIFLAQKERISKDLIVFLGFDNFTRHYIFYLYRIDCYITQHCYWLFILDGYSRNYYIVFEHLKITINIAKLFFYEIHGFGRHYVTGFFLFNGSLRHYRFTFIHLIDTTYTTKLVLYSDFVQSSSLVVFETYKIIPVVKRT